MDTHVDYSKYEYLTVAKIDGIATVTFNRPDARNAISPEVHKEIEYIWTDLARDPEITVIVLTGAGKAFSAGGDIKRMAERAGTEFGLQYALAVPLNTLRIYEHMALTPQPIIAAVNGDAIGLGLTLALFSDISIVADDAKLGDTHVRVGMVAGDGGCVIWPLLIGVQKAKEYLMRGKLFSGAEAAEMGLVNYAEPKDQVLEKAMEIARELVSLPKQAVSWTKQAVNKTVKQQMNLTLDTSIAYESLTMLTHDYKEAANAMVEKRRPSFRGW
ncbi:MAG: enoyl-CoA hydratase/isomerase family protein [Sphingomonadaceae bacterium]|nr:enoyl-CoA hydratase/isomerase family protein [Sphingomonadaceae bacterium]